MLCWGVGNRVAYTVLTLATAGVQEGDIVRTGSNDKREGSDQLRSVKSVYKHPFTDDLITWVRFLNCYQLFVCACMVALFCSCICVPHPQFPS